jgi:hypothetical protein
MTAVLASLLAGLFFLAFGLSTEGYSKIIGAAVTGMCLLTYFVIKLMWCNEKTKPVSLMVGEQFVEIKRVKKSKENAKPISSVSYLGLSLIIVSLLGIILNLSVLGSPISTGIAEIVPIKEQVVAVYWTSAMFSLVSFGVFMILGQIKKGKEFRNAHKKERLKKLVKRDLTEQELLDIIEEKVNDKK